MLGEGSTQAAQVAVAVRMQDKTGGKKYLEFHQKLLGGRGQADKARALAVAKEVGLDMARLEKDMASDEVKTHAGGELQARRGARAQRHAELRRGQRRGRRRGRPAGTQGAGQHRALRQGDLLKPRRRPLTSAKPISARGESRRSGFPFAHEAPIKRQTLCRGSGPWRKPSTSSTVPTSICSARASRRPMAARPSRTSRRSAATAAQAHKLERRIPAVEPRGRAGRLDPRGRRQEGRRRRDQCRGLHPFLGRDPRRGLRR